MQATDNPFYKDLLCLLEEDISDEHIIFNSNLPFVKLDIPPVPVKEIYEELDNIKDFFTIPNQRFDYSDKQYKDFFNKDLTVKPSDDRPLTRIDFNKVNNLFVYDLNPLSEISQKAPFTTNFINTFLGKNIIFHRAQANLLTAGGWISPHVDDIGNDALKYKMGGKPGQLCTLNIAISHPAGSQLYIKNCGNVPFKPGDAYLIDVTRIHGVYNPTSYRYHLVIRFDWINSNLNDKELLKRSYLKTLGNYKY